MLLLFIFFFNMATGQNHTISGIVTDSSSGETLIGAAVMDMRSGKGALTNAQGRYSLTLKSDSASLRISYMGYKTVTEDLPLKGNIKRNYKLISSLELKTVVVRGERIDNAK